MWFYIGIQFHFLLYGEQVFSIPSTKQQVLFPLVFSIKYTHFVSECSILFHFISAWFCTNATQFL